VFAVAYYDRGFRNVFVSAFVLEIFSDDFALFGRQLRIGLYGNVL
jgi:hypothetical protein